MDRPESPDSSIKIKKKTKLISIHIRFFDFLYWKYLDGEIKMKELLHEPSLSKIQEDRAPQTGDLQQTKCFPNGIGNHLKNIWLE